MKKEDIFREFIKLFPDKACLVKDFKKIDSKTIRLEMITGQHLIWEFGNKKLRRKNNMKKEEVYNMFTNMFPEYEDHVIDYKKLGSKMIGLTLDDGTRLSFLYMGKGNWNLGTKPWRKKPVPVKKNSQEKQSV